MIANKSAHDIPNLGLITLSFLSWLRELRSQNGWSLYPLPLLSPNRVNVSLLPDYQLQGQSKLICAVAEEPSSSSA